MVAGGCVYVILWYLYIAVFAVPGYGSHIIAVCGFVTVYDIDILGLYGGLWRDWFGVAVGQLALQYFYLRGADTVCMRVGNAVCAQTLSLG